MQAAGHRLDKRTNGRWVADTLARGAVSLSPDAIVLVDAVRIEGQIDGLREAFGTSVSHLHFTASDEELATRYKRRGGKYEELPSYDAVRADETERRIEELGRVADAVITTDRCTPEDIVIRVAAHLKLEPLSIIPCVDVLVGGQYGSEGKGNIVSFIAREYDYLIRVGGPNAGHTVYEEPKPYTFHQLPSGARHSEAKLIIGPGAVINLDVLLDEIAECEVAHDRLSIDPLAFIIEEGDIVAEGELKEAIGSTGQGVGSAAARRILGRADRSSIRLVEDIPELQRYMRPTLEVLKVAYANGSRILLEGTQGTSLSIFHGRYPHVTSRDTTVSGCLAEAGIPPAMVRRTIMVCRTYPIRVGNTAKGKSGPMSQEITLREISERSGIPLKELRGIERTSTTNRPRRIAEFDWPQLKNSVLLNSPTDIALTFSDYLGIKNRDARRYEQLTNETIRFIEEIERVGGVPVTLISTRFHYRCIIDWRAW